MTVGLARLIGKPGQSNAPVGKKLNQETNACAEAIHSLVRIDAATHRNRIHQCCIIEAFPSSFLGLMLSQPASIRVGRGNRSDRFFEVLTMDGTLSRLLSHLLPGRRQAEGFKNVGNHDDRAALVCAMTALCVAAGDYCMVGDPNGWIVLPPRAFIRDTVWSVLKANAGRGTDGCLFVAEPGKAA